MKSKISRFLISAFLIMTALWIATPKVYIHQMFNHTHEVIKNSKGEQLKAESGQDCEFDKYNTPIYFTIFKFINNFIPLKPKHEAILIHPDASVHSSFRNPDSSRAPPRA